ncbi:MAG: sigma-70 family RNA polymerase sigma factor, partial [Planctomycetota bacterium]
MASDVEHLTRYSQTRDAEAFRAVVRTYQSFVYSVCLRVLGNAADAEDATQECFLALARKAGTVNVSVAGWLHRHATQHCVNRVRRDASRARREREYGEMRMSESDSDTGETAWREVAPEIDRAVDDLPDELRHVLIEHFLRQRSQAEIAEEVGASAATLSRRVRAGVEEVRKALKRAGIVVAATVLGTLLWESSVHAAPATLAAALGKMAIAGVGRSAAAASATGSAVGTGISTAKVMMIATAVTAAVAVGTATVWHYSSRQAPRDQPDLSASEPDGPAAEAPVLTKEPVTISDGPPPRTDPPPRSGIMRGAVFDSQGHPVAGAMVFVITPAPGGGRGLSGHRQPLAWRKVQAATTWPPLSVEGNMLRAKSADDGSFIVEAPKPFWQGEVWVYHPDHVPVTIPDSAWPSRGGDVNLGRVGLSAGASIQGVVTDANGRPAAGALVGAQRIVRWRPGVDLGVPQELVVQRSVPEGEPPAKEYLLLTPRPRRPGDARARRTDADGRYHLAGLEPGLYLLAAWTEARIGGWPNISRSADELETEIPGPRADLRRDFDLKEGATLSLMVSYAGQATPHVELRPRRSTAGGWEICQEPAVIAEANADAEGRCTFQGLRAGTYHVTAHVTEFKLPPVGNAVGVTKHSASGFFKTGEEAKIEIPIKQSVRVAGVVTSAEDGEPVSGFRAQLRSPQDARRGTQRATGLIAVADDGTSQSVGVRGPGPDGGLDEATTGGFAFENVQAGTWTLDITASGWFPKRMDIEVPETGQVEPVRVELVPGRAATSGLVLDNATGEPVPEAVVLCSEALVAGLSHLGSTRRTVTDARGHFTLNRLLGRSDVRRFTFKKAVYVLVPFDRDGAAPLRPELDTVRLVRCGSIIGRVFDAAGRPAMGYVAQVVKGEFLRRVEA